MYPKRCAECGGKIRESFDSLEFDVRGETIVIDGILNGRCADCDEVYLTAHDAGKLQVAAGSKSKAVKSLTGSA
jgi:YgiT-type zinc finger domain-containing protein